MQVEPLLITKEDFKCIGQVAEHCDWETLCTYIREQQNLSLLPKIGYCLFDLLMRYCEGWCVEGAINSCDEYETQVLKHLWIGGRYKACDGTIKVHFGLKRSLVYWSYGAYLYRHGVVDTPFGAVQKLNQDSVPVDIDVLNTINKEQRTNAERFFQMTKDYLCSVKDCSPISECKVCDCISDCACNTCKKGEKGRTLQRRGIMFSNISKHD